jgi:hypothetical protein
MASAGADAVPDCDLSRNHIAKWTDELQKSSFHAFTSDHGLGLVVGQDGHMRHEGALYEDTVLVRYTRR